MNNEVRVAASGCYEIVIDSDNDHASLGVTNYLVINHHAGGAGTELATFSMNGDLTVFGPIVSSTTIHLDCSVGGDPTVFQSGGSAVAQVLQDGFLDVSTGGLKHKVVTSNPNGSLTGRIGQIVFWDDTAGSGSWYLCMCTGTPTTWKKSAAGV